METYQVPEATGADAASRQALHSRPLRPGRDIGGYLAQPAGLLTTLDGAVAILKSRYGQASGAAAAPISAIRIRVAGVHGVDQVSRARVNAVLSEIRRAVPDLDVDIAIGGSPAPLKVRLPAGVAAPGPVTVSEGWLRKGVALAILRAADRMSEVLFGLVLVVCGLFLTQAGLAAVRARRAEIGVLRCLGWNRRDESLLHGRGAPRHAETEPVTRVVADAVHVTVDVRAIPEVVVAGRRVTGLLAHVGARSLGSVAGPVRCRCSPG